MDFCGKCTSDRAWLQQNRHKADRKLRHAQLAVAEICGRARNSYSKGVLKKDFKDGLLEMEETAADVELDARAGPSGAALKDLPYHCAFIPCGEQLLCFDFWQTLCLAEQFDMLPTNLPLPVQLNSAAVSAR